jgi:hypothetical protein
VLVVPPLLQLFAVVWFVLGRGRVPLVLAALLAIAVAVLVVVVSSSAGEAVGAGPFVLVICPVLAAALALSPPSAAGWPRRGPSAAVRRPDPARSPSYAARHAVVLPPARTPPVAARGAAPPAPRSRPAGGRSARRSPRSSRCSSPPRAATSPRCCGRRAALGLVVATPAALAALALAGAGPGAARAGPRLAGARRSPRPVARLLLGVALLFGALGDGRVGRLGTAAARRARWARRAGGARPIRDWTRPPAEGRRPRPRPSGRAGARGR